MTAGHVLGCSWHNGPPWICDGFGCTAAPVDDPVWEATVHGELEEDE